VSCSFDVLLKVRIGPVFILVCVIRQSAALMLRSALFWDITQRIVVYTEVSGQPIGPILEGQEIQEESLDRLSRNVDKDLPVFAA
jgi:hypothetical protein